MENTENKTVETGAEQEQGTETVKTFTQEEVDAMIQAESDRRVTQALAKQAKKQEAKMREAEKLSKMNEDEKFQYELEQREQAIIEKERELAMAENKATATAILADKGLSTSLVDFVVAEDADTMKANIDLLDKAFKLSVRAEVEKRLAGNNPKRSADSKGAAGIDFKNMSLFEQNKLAKEDPELYKALSARN